MIIKYICEETSPGSWRCRSELPAPFPRGWAFVTIIEDSEMSAIHEFHREVYRLINKALTIRKFSIDITSVVSIERVTPEAPLPGADS